ncbi:MAG: peptidoglycan DD-metalloendopeptidase family protein [Actinomycetota bacterium]|nr:peptidoglycan DD-metalloendopeptidase family protein [Actinomycetota bacterium]
MLRKTFWVPMLLALAAYLLLPLPGRSASLSERIEGKRAQVGAKKRKEGVLTTTIQRYDTRIRSLQGEVRSTQKRLSAVQSELDDSRAELLRVRDDLEVARDRLERARSELKAGRRALGNRLVELYKADEPDALTVVLEADGFADLLERTDFLERISKQDSRIVERVRVLKERAERAEKLLADLEHRKQVAAEAILRRRDDIASTRDRLASAQGELRSERNGRRVVLAKVRRDRRRAQEDLAALEREQAKVRNTLAGAAPGAFTPRAGAGPIRRGSGRLIWPINGPLTSPFGMRWGRLHAGIDISAPSGTPIRAADSGRVVLLGFTGGYGNYTCIQHTSSMSTCYAHQSGYNTSSGAGVRQGQVIGYVGNTGHSFGAHLHFEVRIGGSPVNPLGYL